MREFTEINKWLFRLLYWQLWIITYLLNGSHDNMLNRLFKGHDVLYVFCEKEFGVILFIFTARVTWHTVFRKTQKKSFSIKLLQKLAVFFIQSTNINQRHYYPVIWWINVRDYNLLSEQIYTIYNKARIFSDICIYMVSFFLNTSMNV